MARRKGQKKKQKGKAKQLSEPMKKAIVKVVHRSVSKPEMKYTEYVLAPVAITNATTQLYNICVPTEGTSDFNERVGDKILLKGFQMKGTVNANTNASTYEQQIRVIVFRWLPDSLVDVPDITKLLNASNTLSSYEHDMRDKFSILYDQLYYLNKTLSSYWYQFKFEKFKKLNATVEFKNSGTSGKGKIYIAAISSEAIYGPFLQFASRLWYIDN